MSQRALTAARATMTSPPINNQSEIRNPQSEMAAAASDLASDLRSAVQGEVRFDAGSRALYATDALQLPPGADRRRHSPRRATMSSQTIAVCRAHRRADSVARRRHQPRRAMLQRRGRHGHVEVHATACSRSTRSARLARVEPGVVLDDLRTRPRAHGLTFGPDPATHTPLHARRHARQQLLRRPLGDVAVLRARPRTSDNTHELDILTYDGLRMRVGPTSRRRAASGSSRPADAAARSTPR